MNKRIIFDVGHPAQVHNFKYVSKKLKEKGWDILFTAKEKEITSYLLNKYNLPFIIIGKSKSRFFGKTAGLFGTIYKFLKVLIKFKPDIVVCRFSPHACWCCKIMSIPLIGIADTEHTKLLDRLTVPFASVKITDTSYLKDLGRNHIRIKSNIELFYLHPNRFNKNTGIKSELGLNEKDNYVVIRFVSWNAHHDIGEKGIPENEKIRLVDLLKNKYKVIISSEGKLMDQLEKYRVNFPPEKMHDILSHADLYIGEGASMASEAACMGVPSIYVNSLNAGSIIEEEKFGLIINLRNTKELFDMIHKVTEDINIKEKTLENLRLFLSEKIDATAFMEWFIGNWPGSLKTMKEKPDYQFNFK